MDVEQGLCWRCEMRKTKKKCTRCNIAEYCGTQCLDRDKFRHQVECNMWNRKEECVKCKKKIKSSLCSACKEIAYCSRECQRQHWSSHKVECKQIREKVENISKQLRLYFLNDEKQQTMGDTPYYIGNTLAVDVLKLSINEADPSINNSASELARDYNILLAGVGDLRNLLLTTASLPSNFTGNIRFTLNDVDPFLLARNVLFLYMLITQSSKESIAASVTNIWYSVKVPDEDFKLLTSVLSELIEHTVETLNVRTGSHIVIEEEDFEMMKDVWKKWREMECETGKCNSINLSDQRSNVFSRDRDSSVGIESYIFMIPQKYRKSAKEYFENGLFLPQYASKRSNLKYDNPTLTGRPKPTPGNGIPLRLLVQTRPKLYSFVYCIRADILPFSGWDSIQAEKISQPNSIVDLFHTYICSVIKTALASFQKGIVYSKIILKICKEICNEPNIEPQFDRIMTSNIVDYTGIKALLSSMRPLLSRTNKHAVLVTETLNWATLCPEANLNHPINESKCYELSEVVMKDTGRIDLLIPVNTRYDYFDNTNLFIRYLCILILGASNEPLRREIPSFPKAFENIEGFRLRDFTKELNKVIPFQNRCNARLCTANHGLQRNLEWQLV